MTEPVYTLAAELAVGSMTQLQSLCLRASYSREISNIFNSPGPDPALFELSNEVGSMSPLLNSGLVPGRRIELTATHGGSAFNLYAGRIKKFSTRPMLGERTTVIEAVTDVDRLNRTILSTGIFAGINAGSLFTEIMSRSGVQSFTSDTLNDSVDFAWYNDRGAIGAIEELIRSGYYQMYVDGSGTFKMRNRYFGAFSSAVDSLSSGLLDLNYSLSDNQIINSVRAQATPRKQQTSISTLAFLAQPIAIAASGHLSFFASYADPRDGITPTPVGSAITPVASQDYYASANADGTGTDHTSTLSLAFVSFGGAAVASLFNGAGNSVYLSRFQVRGYPILSGAPISVKDEDATSQAQYGISDFQLSDLLITDQNYLRDLVATLITERADPRDSVEVVMKNEFPQVVQYQVGDLLAVVNSLTGVNSSWSIRNMRHEISLTSGLEHTMVLGLEKFTPVPYLVLDDASFGKLDDGRQLAL